MILPTAFFDHTWGGGEILLLNKSEGPEYSKERIKCSISQNGHVTCTEYSDRGLPGSSWLESGKESAPTHM
jgi:hypothetical protein